MKCYQCDGEALLVEKEAKRLFCGTEHHVLYHEGWHKFLAHLNGEQALKKRVLSAIRLGMKRAHDNSDYGSGSDSESDTDSDSDEEHDNEIRFDILENVPMEVLIMVLIRAFPRLGTSKSETREALDVREISFRVREVIEYLCSKVENLYYKVVNDVLDDETIILFTGLEKLEIDLDSTYVTEKALIQMTSLEDLTLYGTQMSEESLSRMTWLKKLGLRRSEHSDEAIRTLSRLESLFLSGSMIKITGKGLCALAPHLRTLTLHHSAPISDADIVCLSNLTNLDFFAGEDLGRTISVTGASLASFPFLETLVIKSNKNVSDEQLVLLASHLKNLVLDWNMRVTDRGLAQMTNLESLSLRGDEESPISDEALLSLTRLKSLDISYRNKKITNRGLSALSSLTHLEANINISKEGLAPFAKTLEHIELDFDARVYHNIQPRDLLEGFPSLKSIKKKMYIDEKAEALFAERGVDVYF